MYEQILDNFRKAAESTLKVQQDMVQNWTRQWTMQTASAMVPNAAAMVGTGWLDQIRTMQKSWSSHVTEMLNKHRESLDAQYKAGIRTIEDAIRVGEAKDPEHFRRLVEELWKQTFETFKSLTESQMKDFQGAAEKWFEAVSKGVPTKI